jgi:hypothetical protein
LEDLINTLRPPLNLNAPRCGSYFRPLSWSLLSTNCYRGWRQIEYGGTGVRIETVTAYYERGLYEWKLIGKHNQHLIISS